MARSTPLPDIRRIAVLRAGGVGDLVFALPALTALRAAYPDAEVLLLGEPWAADLLGTGEPDGPRIVDRVIPLPAGAIAALERRADLDDPGVAELVALVGGPGSLDLAVQLHGGGRESNPLLRRLKARWTIGARTPDAAALDASLPYVYYQPETSRALEVVALAGADGHTDEPHLPATGRGRREAQQALARVGLDAREGAAAPILVHPGAGDPRRRWPVESYGSLVHALLADGLDVALIGSERDRPTTNALSEAVTAGPRVGGRLVDLTATVGLAGLVALAGRAPLVIGNDSGPLHVADAAGAPTVGVYWFGNVINAAPPTRQRHRLAISWRRECPDCGVDCLVAACDHRSSFVADVGVAEVLAAARELLGERAAASWHSGASSPAGPTGALPARRGPASP